MVNISTKAFRLNVFHSHLITNVERHTLKSLEKVTLKSLSIFLQHKKMKIDACHVCQLVECPLSFPKMFCSLKSDKK